MAAIARRFLAIWVSRPQFSSPGNSTCDGGVSFYNRHMGLIITLLVVGVVLLLLETVLPGAVAGIVGLICLIAAVVQSYVEFGPGVGNYVLLGVTVGLIIGTWLWVKYFPTSPFGRKFVLDQTGGNVGAEQPELLHQTGTALTPLRPSGAALINGRRVDVVTEGSMIERGQAVKVVDIEGLRVVVRAV